MKEFDEAWERLLRHAPNAFNGSDKSLARLFYNVGVTAVLERVKQSTQPFVDFARTTEDNPIRR